MSSRRLLLPYQRPVEVPDVSASSSDRFTVMPMPSGVAFEGALQDAISGRASWTATAAQRLTRDQELALQRREHTLLGIHLSWCCPDRIVQIKPDVAGLEAASVRLLSRGR